MVYKDRPGTRSADPPTEPLRSTSTILNRDFRRVGVTWRVRKGGGVTYSFHDLATLMSHLENGRVDGTDSLSYDARTWVPLDSIEDVRSYFEDIWRKAERGEIVEPSPSRVGMTYGEDEEEGPTTIMGHGHALMDDIRKAVAEATTPPPSPGRGAGGSPRGFTPRPPPPVRDHREPHSADDPTTFSRRATGTATGGGLTPSSSDVRAHRPGGRAGGTNPPVRRDAGAPVAPSRVDSDNLMLIITSVVAILVVAASLVGVLWITGWGLPADPMPVEPRPSIAPSMPANGLAPSGAVEGGAAGGQDAVGADAGGTPAEKPSPLPGDAIPADR